MHVYITNAPPAVEEVYVDITQVLSGISTKRFNTSRLIVYTTYTCRHKPCLGDVYNLYTCI